MQTRKENKIKKTKAGPAEPDLYILSRNIRMEPPLQKKFYVCSSMYVYVYKNVDKKEFVVVNKDVNGMGQR